MEPIIQSGNIHTGPRKGGGLNVTAQDLVSFSVNEPYTHLTLPKPQVQQDLKSDNNN